MMTARPPLKRVATIRVSNVDKKSVEGDTPVRLCNYTDVYRRQVILADQEFMAATATDEQLRTFRLLPGDVLITKDSETAGDIAVPAYVGTSAADLVCGYHLAIIRPRTGKIDGRFLYWCMISDFVRNQLAVGATGVTRFGLRTDTIGACTVYCPSHPHQRAIADFLDVETARIDALIRKKTQLAEAIRRRHRAWVERLLLDEATDVVPLQYLTDPRRPIVYGIVQAGPQVSDGVPYIKSGDLSQFDVENLSKTSTQIDEKYSRARVHPGDIVMAMRASIGKVIMIPRCLQSANLTQGTARIAANHEVDPHWLLEALSTHYVQEQCQLRAVGTTFKTLNIWDLRRILVPRAPSATQKQLAGRIGDVAATLEQILRRLNRQVALLRQHRQSLITAAVRGDLDVRGTAA